MTRDRVPPTPRQPLSPETKRKFERRAAEIREQLEAIDRKLGRRPRRRG